MTRKTATTGRKKGKGKPKQRPARRALTPEREVEVVAAFLAGETQPGLAERFGVGLNTIARCLGRHGVSAATREAATEAGKADPAAIDLYRAVGLPPLGNTLGSSGWMHRALVAMAAQAITDPALTEKQRRRDMVALARAATASFPLAVIDEAQKIIGAERDLLKKFDRDPPLESAADLDARARAAGHEPMKSVNASEWEGRSPEDLES